ncbi:MAG: hypothetical protein RQ714_08230 [Nitrosomonas sp.]|nr:hypothetical protein [Nitrosomonas sp.]
MRLIYLHIYAADKPEHETIAAELDVDAYFAHPCHSWERGLNENNNARRRNR